MAIDIGADLPGGARPQDFLKLAGDYEAALGTSTDTLMTWSAQLETSISSVNRFSTAIDLASKALGKIQGPGMSNSASQMSPAMMQSMTSAMSAAIGTAMGNLMSNPAMRAMAAGGGGSPSAPTPGLGTTPRMPSTNAAAISGAGQSAQAAGLAMGGKAGGMLAAGGGAAVKFAPVIGQVITILQGVWATLKIIESIQVKVQEDQRKALMKGAAIGGIGSGSDIGSVRQLALDVNTQAKMNAFTPAEVTLASQQKLMQTQGLSREFVNKLTMPEASVDVMNPLMMGNPVGQGMMGARGAFGKNPNTLGMGTVPGLMATGYSSDTISGGIGGNVSRFGGFDQKSMEDAATSYIKELREMKVASASLRMDQMRYLDIQEQLINANRLAVDSVDSVRDEMLVFGKAIQQGEISVKMLSDTLRGTGSKGFGQMMTQMALTGEAQAKVLEKRGFSEEAAALRRASSSASPDAQAAAQDAIRKVTQGAQGGAIALELNKAKNDVMGKSLGMDTQGAGMRYVPGMFGSLNQAMDLGSTNAAEQQKFRDLQASGGGRAAASAARPEAEAQLEKTRETMSHLQRTLMTTLVEPFRQPFAEFKSGLNTAAEGLERFARRATTAGTTLGDAD